MNNNIRYIIGYLLLSCTLFLFSTGSVLASSPADPKSPKGCLQVETRSNLVMNPGFESGGATPEGWMFITPGAERSRTWQMEVLKGVELAHSGIAAVKIGPIFNGINSESSWLDRVIVESDRFRLIPGNKYYLLFLWVNMTNIENGHATVKIKYFDQTGKQLVTRGHRWDNFYLESYGRKGWHRYAYFVAPPEYAADLHGKRSVASMAAVSISLDNTQGAIVFDDIGFMPISNNENSEHNPGLNYLPPKIQKNTHTKLFNKDRPRTRISLEQHNGIWSFFSRDASPFWSLGLTFSTNQFILDKTGLSRSEYLRKANARAGKDLLFNQGIRIPSGEGDSAPLHHYIEWLNFSSEADIDESPDNWVAKDINGNLIDGYTHYFPDVFSPLWQEHAVREAEKLLDGDGWVLENNEVIGYWTDNEWAYGDLYDFIWGDTSKLAFIDWLQGKNSLPSVDLIFKKAGCRINIDVPEGFEKISPFRTIEDLNKAWSSMYHRYRYTSFEHILEQRDVLVRAHNDPVFNDLRAFARLMYKLYVDTVIDNIRKVESDFSLRTGLKASHLIFSNRFSIESPAALTELKRNMDLFDRFDVIAVNLYPGYNNSAMYYPRSLLMQIKHTFHDTTGKPLYISEFGVAAEDASNCRQTPCLSVERWRPQTVDTQDDRGRAYTNIISTLSQLPWVVGANWFQWTNGYGSPEGNDPRNCGLVDDNDKYYKPLAENIRATNSKIALINRSPDFKLDDVDWSKIKINICEPENRQ